MSLHSSLFVKVVRIAHVRLAECLAQRFLLLRANDKMDMIVHQTIGIDHRSRFPAVFLDVLEIYGSVLVVFKKILSVISALGNMLNISGGNNTCFSGHDTLFYRERLELKKLKLGGNR